MAYFFHIALTAYAAQCIEIKNVVKFSINTSTLQNILVLEGLLQPADLIH